MVRLYLLDRRGLMMISASLQTTLISKCIWAAAAEKFMNNTD